MNVFITGGTGFIGSYIVNMLVQNGHQITLLARNRNKIPLFLQNSLIKIEEATLSDYSIISSCLKGKDACIHVALGWGETPTTMLENDTLPSIKIFEAAVDAGVKQIVYTSSTAAIGELRTIMNQDTTTRPVDLYGATKAATENYLLAVSAAYNIRCNIIRPGYTFGNPVVSDASMQPDKRFINIITKALSGKPIDLIKNDGTQFIWAGDLALLYNHVLNSNYNRSIFFGLGTVFITWEEIANYAVKYTGSKSNIVIKDLGWKKGDCWFDVSYTSKCLNKDIDATEKIKEHVRFIADNLLKEFTPI